MSSVRDRITILVADDDAEDRTFIREGFEEAELPHDLRFVEDGEELMDYLLHRGRYEQEPGPQPGIILIDLNMPRKDGREALREIKGHESLRRIPVVALTTSRAEEDIVRTYNDGVNSFITKPVAFEKLVEVLNSLERYWFETVELPPLC